MDINKRSRVADVEIIQKRDCYSSWWVVGDWESGNPKHPNHGHVTSNRVLNNRNEKTVRIDLPI